MNAMLLIFPLSFTLKLWEVCIGMQKDCITILQKATAGSEKSWKDGRKAKTNTTTDNTRSHSDPAAVDDGSADRPIELPGSFRIAEGPVTRRWSPGLPVWRIQWGKLTRQDPSYRSDEDQWRVFQKAVRTNMIIEIYWIFLRINNIFYYLFFIGDHLCYFYIPIFMQTLKDSLVWSHQNQHSPRYRFVLHNSYSNILSKTDPYL